MERALTHMLALMGIYLLVLMLAFLLTKCRPYLSYFSAVDQHKDMKVMGLLLPNSRFANSPVQPLIGKSGRLYIRVEKYNLLILVV